MDENDYFYDSVSDGISAAISEFDSKIECCNQDSYELLAETWGKNVQESDLNNATQTELKRFAQKMKDYFELTYLPSTNDTQAIINRALGQWHG